MDNNLYQQMKQQTQNHQNQETFNTEKTGDSSHISHLSGRTLAKVARKPKGERIKAIESFYGIYTNEEIAGLCGVNRRTIQEDLLEWKSGSLYQEWLDREWTRLYRLNTIPDLEKFRALTTLKKQYLMGIMVNKSVQGSSVSICIVDDQPKVEQVDSKDIEQLNK